MKVLSSEGSVLGKVWDLAVDLDLPEPEVKKIIYRVRWSFKCKSISWDDVVSVDDAIVKIKPDASIGSPTTGSPSEIFLRDFLLDKQIVDMNGAKVERVNDLQFLLSNAKLILVQVDVGFRGFLRRLGWEKVVAAFTEWFFDYDLKSSLIAWHFVQPLADPDRLRLQVPGTQLDALHPADLADIIEDMDVHEREAVVDALEEEVLADALEEMDPKVQVSIIESLEPEKAADIIEEMSPDEAADLIADLRKDTADIIFKEIDSEYGDKVKGLLAHDEDEAGGLMTTQFVALPGNQTIVETLAHIRQNAAEIDAIYYVYIVDSDSRLQGVASLKEVLSHEVFTPLEQIMSTRLVTVQTDEEAKDLAALFAKYGFRAIPVVDDESRILGVVRFKALLEILAPHLGQ